MRKTNKKKTSSTVISNGLLEINNELDGAWSVAPKSKRDRKVKFSYLLKKLQEKVTLRENQLEYSKKIENSTITFVTGAAGTSKTWTACYTLLKLLFEEKIEKIIFTKPIKESGENLGFLPGGIEEKLEPYMESFIFTCKEMIGEDYIKYLIEHKFIENKALAYMRGITLNNCGLFLDEAQNCVYEQFILYITRLGKNSKMVISGDVTQRDIEKKKVVLPEFIEMIGDLEGISTHMMRREDIVRNSLLIKITERYENWKDKNNK